MHECTHVLECGSSTFTSRYLAVSLGWVSVSFCLLGCRSRPGRVQPGRSGAIRGSSLTRRAAVQRKHLSKDPRGLGGMGLCGKNNALEECGGSKRRAASLGQEESEQTCGEPSFDLKKTRGGAQPEQDQRTTTEWVCLNEQEQHRLYIQHCDAIIACNKRLAIEKLQSACSLMRLSSEFFGGTTPVARSSFRIILSWCSGLPCTLLNCKSCCMRTSDPPICQLGFSSGMLRRWCRYGAIGEAQAFSGLRDQAVSRRRSTWAKGHAEMHPARGDIYLVC